VGFSRVLIYTVTAYLLSGALALAQGDQTSLPSASTATVPRLIRIRGTVRKAAHRGNWDHVFAVRGRE